MFQASKQEILEKLEIAYRLMSEESDEDAPYGLVIDGKALEIALRNDVKDKFLQLAVNCASVLCCRVSPKQKALVEILFHESSSIVNDLSLASEVNLQLGKLADNTIGEGIYKEDYIGNRRRCE